MEKFEITRRAIRPGSVAEQIINRCAADGDLPSGFSLIRPRYGVAFKLLRRLGKEWPEQSQEHDADQGCDDEAGAVHSMGSTLNANRFANECNDNAEAEQRAAQPATDGA